MTFQERYQYNPKTDLLGKGGFARVYKAKDILLDREVAIKIFNATDKGQYTVIEEIKKAIRLQHPNLLRYFDVAVVENTNALGESEVLQIGVMELANSGDLKQFVKNYPNSPLLFKLLKQVLSGLEYLHSKGIIHRDLKPQNILLVEEDGELTARISDFGISKSMDSGTNSASMAIGTIEYMAPEQFNPAKYGINGKISTNVDLWSFGIMVHELLTNEPLFGQRSGNTTAEQIMNAILSQDIPPGIETLPEPYRSIVKKCLVADARIRIQKANELIVILENDTSNSFDSSAETIRMDKNLINKVLEQTASETVLFEKTKFESKNKEKEKITPSKPKINRKVILLSVILIIGLLAGAWWWGTKNTLKIDKEGADNEYRMALQAKEKRDTTGFITHLFIANKLGSDSASLLLAKTYVEEDRIQDAAPIIEKLIRNEDGKITTNFPEALPLYALVLQKKNKSDQAVQLLQSCANEGNTDCCYQLGMFYFEGTAVKQEYSKALEWFKKAADQNNDRAQTMLGNMYIMGQGVTQDNSAAINYYFKAVNKGNAVAMYALGLAYANGRGVEQSETEAKKWFNQVLEKGNNPDLINAAKQQLAN